MGWVKTTFLAFRTRLAQKIRNILYFPLRISNKISYLLQRVVTECIMQLTVSGMRIFGPKYSMNESKGFYIVKPKPEASHKAKRNIGIVVLFVAVSNFFTYSMSKSDDPATQMMASSESTSLYLLEEASIHISNTDAFEKKVRQVSARLGIPPEWLMSVMYSESKFDPSALNHKGSGATGLIQFMVPTVKDLNARMGTELYMSDIRNMPAVAQLDLVYEYLRNVQEKYGGYNSLTELYLAILYPKAVGQDYCYTLYGRPSKRYSQNSGLDENRDGRVTISDIDMRMQRIFPTAYIATND